MTQQQHPHKKVNQGADTLPQWLIKRQDQDAEDARQEELNELLHSDEYLDSDL